ncbi:MAG: stage 0 sporulation family protein [Clostridia bacterium]|nr:stage 0 sporulation family protein [Clostridia bacterium]
MTDVVSVQFKGRGKSYFFDPNGVDCHEGQQVVVETSKGLELAECVQGPHTVMDERIVPPLRPIVRVATADDLRVAELCKQREKEAFGICEQKIAAHGLDMKLVDVECNFEGNKILFFFTSDGRVDFRELVKDLASVFRARIELRQIGVRDEAKMLGGLGICGRPFCCHAFLDDFEPVSTKMAKTQSLSLNPTKISGSCGRLMCCLRYEQEAYEELVKTVPKNGAFVQTPCGYGNVCQVNLLRQKVKVKLDGSDEPPKGFDAYEVAAIPGGRPKPGEPLPDVLVLKPKEEEEVLPETKWELPPIFAEDTKADALPEAAPEAAEQPAAKKSSRSRNRRRGGGAKPQGEAQAQQPKQAQQAENKKPQQQQQQPKQPQNQPAQSGEKAEGGAAKKNNNRRRYRGKTKNKNPQGGSAPKAE